MQMVCGHSTSGTVTHQIILRTPRLFAWHIFGTLIGLSCDFHNNPVKREGQVPFTFWVLSQGAGISGAQLRK